jgi:hypothetical protein
MTIITVESPNKILLAVSSGPTITNTSSFKFFKFQQDQVGPKPNVDTGFLADYDTLGVDKNALYIGVNIFKGLTGSFSNSTAFVVRKSSLISGGPIVVTAFRGLISSTGAGPFTPQGVDNNDPVAAAGYFIGVDAAFFGKLDLRRVSNPGTTPTLSGNLPLTVPTTQFPINVAAKKGALIPSMRSTTACLRLKSTLISLLACACCVLRTISRSIVQVWLPPVAAEMAAVGIKLVR